MTPGKAPPEKPAFQPYWGKPAVRNDRGDRGNVGIIRSPVRASILPDHLPALAVDVFVEVLRRAVERGDDIADVDLLVHSGLSGDRLQRAFEPRHHLAWLPPAGGLVHEARKRAQLRLAAHRMMEAQIVGDLHHQGVERGIAGEAEDVVGFVALSPVHRLDAAVVTVAAPDDLVFGQCCFRRLVTCLITVLTSVPFGVRAGRRIATTGVPLAT